MRLYKRIVLLKLLIMTAFTGSAQKEIHDVFSYTLPAGWKKDPKENNLQVYITDSKTGEYALALMVNSIESGGSASENFNKLWTTMVKGSVNVSEEPTMQSPAKDQGWDIIAGQANYIDGENKGVVTQKTATGYGKMATVIVMTNTRRYQMDLDNLLNSIGFTALTTIQEKNTSPSVGANNPSIAGLWVRYLVETSGTFSNGMPMTTAGYFRYEYRFNPDGTYRYLEKTFSVFNKSIIFGYETGTWSVNGDKLTIKPLQGKSEEWSKSASGRTSEWGSRVKSVNRKLETVTYTYKLHYYSGMNETDLLLQYAKPTERDGRQSNDDNHPNEWSYSPRELDKSLIDLPPGTKISFDARPQSSGSIQQAGLNQSVNKASSLIAGKIWEGSTNEKFNTGSMNGFSTGGSFTWQYKFNADGTYRFVYVGASAYVDPNSFQYETGTYSINGNQLTIIPAKGANEEWSIKEGPVSLSGMSDVQIRNIKKQWGKRLKTENRKLEKITYTFSVEYLEGNHANALILQYNGSTVREGSGNKAYYFETAADKSIKLPDGVK